MVVIHKNSSDASAVPESLRSGEIAIRTAAGEERLFIKNSRDGISDFITRERTIAEIDSRVSRMMTDTELKFFCVEPVTVTVTTASGSTDRREFAANTLVDMFMNSADTFEVTTTSASSISMLMAWPGALGTFYDWLEGVSVFDGILFDMNSTDMYIKWSQHTQGVYHVQQAQYTNCIFWSDLPFILNPISERNNYTLNRSANLPLCYSAVPENTFKPFFCCYSVVCDPNLSSTLWLEGLARSTTATSPWAYYGIINLGSTDDMEHNVIMLPSDSRGLMFYAQALTTAGILDAANVTTFGAGTTNWRAAFGECIHLQTLLIKNLKVNLDVSWSPISQDSLNFIISKAANEGTITISLSPYTFYRLTDANKELAASKSIDLKLITTNSADDNRFAAITAQLEALQSELATVDSRIAAAVTQALNTEV